MASVAGVASVASVASVATGARLTGPADVADVAVEAVSGGTPAIEGAFGVLERCVAEGLTPGAVAAVGTAERTLWRAAYGWAELTPERREMREDALFDVASLTKVVVTTSLALRYAEQGKLHLGRRVAALLPGFEQMGKDQVTLRHLLTHTSGLRPGVGVPRDAEGGGPVEGSGRAAVLEAVNRLPLDRPPGTAVVYSDAGFIALGAALEAIGGASLDALAGREVLEPLGMADAQFCPPPAARARCVATEVVPSRGGAVVGSVHDETAALQGGVSGHAGLFATCGDLERFCRAWLGGGELDGRRFLSGAAVAAATRDQTGHGERRRGYGWVLQPNPLWPPADLCSPEAYGHTGFTGTSVVIDPHHGIFAVLLTNRIHPTREGTVEQIATVRARFHNAIWAALSS